MGGHRPEGVDDLGPQLGLRGGAGANQRRCTEAQGITYFLLDLDQPGVDVRPLRHITGEIDFNEVFLDDARVPDTQRVGAVDDGWRVANATLSGERQMCPDPGPAGSTGSAVRVSNG